MALLLLLVIAGIGALGTLPVRAGAASLSVLDVGQGDSVVVDAGMPVMVDTGDRGSGALAKAGGQVAALIITHLHDDHAGDAVAVIRTRPAAVFWNGRTDAALHDAIAAEAARQGVPLVALLPGDRLGAGRASLLVLGPSPGYRTSGDPNDTSLVLRAELTGFSALLTGDLPSEAEAGLPEALLDVDVLKVGHHGSKGSTSDLLLEAATPEVAVISSGKGNRYGHPTPETLGRLEERGIAVRRTDTEGDVAIGGADIAHRVD